MCRCSLREQASFRGAKSDYENEDLNGETAMQAMLLDEIAPIDRSPLRRAELPPPAPQAGQVRVRVRCCAICRTDLHVIEGDLPRHTRPIIPGHQVVGIVDALGPGCGRLEPGQRVGIAWLGRTCGTCGFCSSGRENLCESAQFTGYHLNGGYADYALVAEDFAYPIPEAFSDVEAAPLLCAGIIGYRSLRRSQVPDGGRLALYGFGSSAHVVIQIARHRGCEVYVVTRGEKHRQLAREMGAVWVGEEAHQMPVKAHSAIIFAPVGELVPPALEALEKGGTLALAGIHMSPIPEMDYDRYVFYERDIHSVTCNTREDGRSLLQEAAQIPIRPHTTCYPLAEANRALQDLKNDQINGTGVLVVE
jgi:propanol-preferring alcohol dehydrogenase